MRPWAFPTLAPERMARSVEPTDRMTKRLTHLVNAMLDIPQIDRGKLSLQTEACALAELVAETPGKPTAPRARPGRVGSLEAEQVIINGLTNAARYERRKPIKVTVLRRSSTAELKVRDHGRGIAKEDQQRIFHRFERAITASEVSGLGLGLYIARQIAEMHQGTIEVVHALSEGAVFTVTLPVVTDAPS